MTTSRHRSMHRRSRHVITFLVLLLIISSCTRKTVYHHYEPAPIAGLEKNDTLFFHVAPMKKSAVLREEVGLRINSLYPFMGLSLIVQQTTLHRQAEKGNVMRNHITRTDTLNCNLIDQRGNTKGKGINFYQYDFHLTDLSLNDGDSLCIAIHHNMKREILPGIVDVGIKLQAY